MDLEKQNIHMSKILKQEMSTFYVAFEKGLSDPDDTIESIISHREIVSVNNTLIRNNQLFINGTVSYGIMYYPEKGENPSGTEDEVDFEESVKINGLDENCNVNIGVVPLSTTVRLIDNKNYIYKIQVLANITIEKMEDLELVSSIEREDAMKKYNKLKSLSIVANKHETFRINETVSLPSNKPAIQQVIWKDVKIKSINTRMLNGLIQVNGELKLFVIYIPEGERENWQWFDTTVGFAGTIDTPEAAEELVEYINGDIHSAEIAVDMNQDNEMRDITIMAMLKFGIKIFQERENEVLEDVYSPKANLVPDIETKEYQNLLVKNESRTKVAVKMDVEAGGGNILQICNSDAKIKVDNVVIEKNGIKVMGKVVADIIYVSSDDVRPICSSKKEIEFEHIIDAEGIEDDDKYYIDWKVEQVNGNMTSTNQVEVKAVIALQAMVMKEQKRKFIVEINEKEPDTEKINQAPFLKGYIVNQGDTLWKLAKENFTTMDSIMKVNGMEDENIKPGDRLLIIKSCQ